MSVCLSVGQHISGTAGSNFTKVVAQNSCGRASILLWRRCDTLCTSGIMDYVTFSPSGPYGNAWKACSLTASVVNYFVLRGDRRSACGDIRQSGQLAYLFFCLFFFVLKKILLLHLSLLHALIIIAYLRLAASDVTSRMRLYIHFQF